MQIGGFQAATGPAKPRYMPSTGASDASRRRPRQTPGVIEMIVGIHEAPIFASDTEWDRAQAALNEARFGDGLPLVVPTRARIDRMLDGIVNSGRSLGSLPPMQGELTIGAVAYCCVLAGCTPPELPVVLTAATATLEPDFNLLGIQTTTGTAAVCLVVHGPVVAQLGMNSGANCLGPGNRANACIGRALQLVLSKIGGAIPGETDMATMGQPGKYAFCFAEGSHSLIPPLPVRRGLDGGVSAVTVIGVSGTQEVLPRRPGTEPEMVLLPIVDAMHGARLANNGGEERPGREQFALIPHEMADLIQKHGWDLPAIQDFLWQNPPPNAGTPWPLTRTARDMHLISTGGIGVKMTCLAPWAGGSVSVTRALLSIRP